MRCSAKKFPKPFYRSARSCWFVQLGREQVRLHADETEALRLYHELMAARSQPAPQRVKPAPSGPTVAEILDKYLGWWKGHRGSRTYDWYRDHIQSFLDHAPAVARGPAVDLKPFHVVEWVDAHASDWSPAYRRGAIIGVQRPFNWAVKLGYLPVSPIPHIEKPTPQRRETRVTPADWEKIQARYPEGDPFLDLLEFAWESGCRPQEAKRVEVRHLDLAGQRVVFPADEAKGKRRVRVIHLSPRAVRIVAPLAAGHPDGPVFLNAAGNAWTAQAMACRFGRLKKHVGVKFAAYDFRHGFCQRFLEGGADHLAVAELMGHSDGKMVATVYSHMNRADQHLRDTLKKAGGGAGAW